VTPATHQIQHGYLHHALVEVRRSVFDHLDSNDFLRFQILTFDDLAKRALAENVEDEIAIPERVSMRARRA
jgi:hypothetical protein